MAGNPTASVDLTPASPLPTSELDPASTFTVPTTGAQLTFLSSVPLISEVCQLIRSDAFSGSLAPEYVTSQDGLRWRCELRLPSLAAFEQRRTFTSSACASKAEAKQSCAFQAAVALYHAGGLTDQLKPKRVSQKRSEGLVDASGRVVADPVQDEPSTTIEVANPFGNVSAPASKALLHVIELKEEGQATLRLGLVCAADLGRFERGTLYPGPGRRMSVRLVKVERLDWPEEERKANVDKLQHLNTTSFGVVLHKRLLRDRPVHLALWTPLTAENEIDWDLVNNPLSKIDSSSINLEPHSSIVVPNPRPSNRMHRLIQIRPDVNTLSPTDQVETTDLGLSKSKLKLAKKYTIYQHYANVVFDAEIDRTTPEPVLQGRGVPFRVPNMLVEPSDAPELEPAGPGEVSVRNFPLSLCRTSRLPEWWWQAMTSIPSLERMIHDRVSVANSLARLGLPEELDLELSVAALTPTNANTGYDYQTLEFYGDSVLKLLTTTHLFLDKPRTDEGVLSALRQNSIGNLFLRNRSQAVGLDSAVLPALFRTVSWVLASVSSESARKSEAEIYTSHTVALKVLSDTTEAVLGVGWLSGGLPVALEVADKLGMCTGGPSLWHTRKELDSLLSNLYDVELPPGMSAVEDKLGYKFRHRQLLLTAFTHRSYISATGYHMDRLEFLGDALLEFYVTQRLYEAFPDGSARSLTFVRARAVSGPTISYLGIEKLGVHEHILHSSPLLPAALAEAVEDAEPISWTDVALGLVTWVFQPPKVLGDVVEALIGAVWVDSRGSLEAVYEVLDGLYDEVLPKLEVAELRDPVSQLTMSRQSLQCTALESVTTQHASPPTFTTAWKWHGRTLASAQATNATVAVQLAAKDALPVLHAHIDDARGRGEDPCPCVGVARREKEGRKRQRKVDKARAGRQGEGVVAEQQEADDGRKMQAAQEAGEVHPESQDTGVSDGADGKGGEGGEIKVAREVEVIEAPTQGCI